MNDPLLRGDMESTSKQFAMVPWDVLDDDRLSFEAKGAYAEVVRVAFDGVATIVYSSIAKRMKSGKLGSLAAATQRVGVSES